MGWFAEESAAGAVRWRLPASASGAGEDRAAAREAWWDGWLGEAHEAQRPPEGGWRTWLFLGGRGAGKTRAGAAWLCRRAVPGARLAIAGQSLHDVREVMVEGPSGIRAISPPGLRPRWEASRRRLVWPNGAEAHAFSAEDAEALRGPQHHAAWADEWCAWKRPEHALAMLRMGLRLGDDPRLMISTTPKPTGALRRLMAEADCATSRGGTALNAANLSPGFLEGLEKRWGGTRLAAQELDGVVVESEGVSLWTAAGLAACRARAGEAAPAMGRVVVAVDPPAGSGEGSACGIVVAGKAGERAWVLADRTVERASPGEWAAAVGRAVTDFRADEVVAEANQGGAMVEQVLRGAGVRARVRLVRATEGKRARAEPAAALYEQGRVTHAAVFAELEEQMLALGGAEAPEPGAGSPDRADALVWALTALMLGPPREGPRVLWT